MCRNEGRARFQAFADLLTGSLTFLDIQKMKGEQTNSAVERSIRGIVDITFNEVDATCILAEGICRQL